MTAKSWVLYGQQRRQTGGFFAKLRCLGRGAARRWTRKTQAISEIRHAEQAFDQLRATGQHQPTVSGRGDHGAVCQTATALTRLITNSVAGQYLAQRWGWGEASSGLQLQA